MKANFVESAPPYKLPVAPLWKLSSRSCDLIFAVVNGEDPMLTGSRLGLSVLAILNILSTSDNKKIVEAYHKKNALSSEEIRSTLSKHIRLHQIVK